MASLIIITYVYYVIFTEPLVPDSPTIRSKAQETKTGNKFIQSIMIKFFVTIIGAQD